MAVNRGKQFEQVIHRAFDKLPNVSIDRLHDQTTGFLGSTNICDFIVYRKPYEYYFECKSVHGNILPFTNITNNQWQGLLQKSQITGVYAGVICWWVDKDITLFIPIQLLQMLKEQQYKSIRYDYDVYKDVKHFYEYSVYTINGKKKRVLFEYDMEGFLNEISNRG